MDFNKALNSAKYIIGISLAFNLLAFAVSAALNILGVVGGTAVGSTDTGLAATAIIAIILWGVNTLVNAGIIVYGGFRAAKQGLDLISCGLIGLLSWGVVAPVIGVIEFIANLVFQLGLDASGLTQTTSGITAAGTVVYMACLLGVYVAGFGLNFVVALIGAFVGGARR